MRRILPVTLDRYWAEVFPGLQAYLQARWHRAYGVPIRGMTALERMQYQNDLGLRDLRSHLCEGLDRLRVDLGRRMA